MRVSQLAVALTAILVMSPSAGANARTPDIASAITVINSAIQSLQQKPNQFYLQVNCVGVEAISNGSGTGLSVTATGGGPGSRTTGLVVTAGGGQCTADQNAVNNAVDQQSEKAVQILEQIKSGLQAPKIDKPTITSELKDFTTTYVAPVLQSVISAVVLKALHLPA